MVEYLNQLNESQLQAVEYNQGPSLIIAGAGSGKTRVLTYKIAYLMSLGLAPHNILALTFTNKAAREMKQRIAALEGEATSRRLWMGTFHSIFSRILRRESEFLGYSSDFTIYDTSDSRNLLKTIIKEMNLDDKVYKPAKIQGAISMAKNQLFSPERYAQDKEIIEHDMRANVPMTSEIFKVYNARLKASNAMDFDDLLFNTNVLLRNHPDVLARYQQQFQFILVDEYQDTNFSQHLIVKRLADAHHRVCVVGDDAQSIYSFRGANIENILNFRKDYPEAKIFKLERNYRSTQNIVNAANSLIQKNTEQLEKNVFSKNEVGDRIVVAGAFSDFEEGMIVSNKVADLRRSGKASYGDFAVLYRTNAQSRIFEEAFRKKNIPYRIYGGLSFYQRKEIKDVIAYFRLVINPNDEEAFKRIINFPARGIGDTTVGKIAAAAKLHNASLWNVLSDPLAFNVNINSGTAKKLAAFREMIESFLQQLRELSAYDMAMLITKQSGVANDAYQDKSPEGMSRQENLEELLGAIHEFTDSRMEEGEDNFLLPDFLSEVSLLTDQDTDKDAEAEKVTMMTIHSAKGLEFKNVFVVGLEEELFPSSMALSEVKGVEEERRLFYVALTRAEEFCMLSYARSRFRNGQTESSNPSRFLKEIGEEYLDIQDSMLSRSLSWGNERREPSFSGGSSSSGRWSSPSEERSKRESPFQKQQATQPTLPRPNFVKAENARPKAGNDYAGDDVKPGDVIAHERFGMGTIKEVSGDANSRKATVEFENAGVKQLLLKFAKYKKVR
ncbi:MAG: ATP-dependent DNA helicase [Bacteroidales bacterium 45-6]|nr:MAG: ATP-dependent DNA helicase [Bacteroidales bacterium 45-6]